MPQTSIYINFVKLVSMANINITEDYGFSL